MTDTLVRPGWYPRPDRPEALAYWDGEAWTGDLAPMPAEPSASGLVVAGWIFAIVFPLLGFFIGLDATTKGRAEGKQIMVLSVVLGVLYALLSLPLALR